MHWARSQQNLKERLSGINQSARISNLGLKLNGFYTHYQLMLSTVDTMHYLSPTGNMLIYTMDKAHTKCKLL